MEQNLPDWEISKLYSSSWQIIKQSKLLWLLGLAAGGTGLQISNYRSADFSKFFNQQGNQELPQKTAQVLAAATSSPFTQSLQAIFGAIPLSFYLILGAETLILVFIALAISIVYSAWGQGASIYAADLARGDKQLTLEEVSSQVRSHLPALVWLNIIPTLVLVLSFIAATTILSLGIALGNDIVKTIFIILTTVAVGAFIYWSIMLTQALIWAPRLVVLEGKFSKAALFSSFKIAKKKFWATLLLGLVNNILAAVISLIVFGGAVVIWGILILIGYLITKLTTNLTFFLIILAVPVVVATIITLSLFGGIINAFKATVWTLAYQQIKGKYDQ